MSIDIYRYRQLFAYFNIKLIEPVLSHHREVTLLRILFLSFDYKILSLPAVARCTGNSTTGFGRKNNFTCDIHLLITL